MKRGEVRLKGFAVQSPFNWGNNKGYVQFELLAMPLKAPLKLTNFLLKQSAVSIMPGGELIPYVAAAGGGSLVMGSQLIARVMTPLLDHSRCTSDRYSHWSQWESKSSA